MPNLLTYRALTANCGNDGIGNDASITVASMVKDKLDFVIVNCQEVNFDIAQKQLEDALGKDSEYTVTLVGKMVTHTKFKTQFHNNTGLASFIIHKKEDLIENIDSVNVRRNLAKSTGFNKGAVVTNFTIKNTTIQAISAHDDSTKKDMRIKDHLNTYQATVKEHVADWDALVQAIPNIRVAGYDANTRNYYVKGQSPIKIWELIESPQELKGLQQAPLGALHFSKDSTYKTSKDDITTVEDKKRPGYVRGGSLDFVDIAADDMTESSSKIITDNSVSAVGSDLSTKRDHDVIISPLQHYNQSSSLSQLDRIKNQMSAQLSVCAPKLSQEIRTFTENDQTRLIEIYNLYLSKHGLLSKQLALQVESLSCIEEINKISPDLATQIEKRLLVNEPWLSLSPQDIEKKQAAQAALIDILKYCKNKNDVTTILHATASPDTFDATVMEIKARAQIDYIKRCVQYLSEKIKPSESDSPSPHQRAKNISQHLVDFSNKLFKLTPTSSVARDLINTTQSCSAKLSDLPKQESSKIAFGHRAITIIVKQFIIEISKLVGNSIIIAKNSSAYPTKPINSLNKSIADYKKDNNDMRRSEISDRSPDEPRHPK